MQLRGDELEAWARLTQTSAETVRADLLRGHTHPDDLRVTRDARGLAAAVRAYAHHPGAYILLIAGARPGRDRDIAPLLIESAQSVRRRGARTLSARVPEAWMPLVEEALRSAGLSFLGWRVEYMVDLAAIPPQPLTDDLVWRTTTPEDPTGLAVLKAALRSAPLAPPDVEAALMEWLDAGLRGAIWLGFDAERAVVWVLPQVDAETGWSRIAYLGVAPDARRRGVGRAGLRFGVERLRALGGLRWNDGTAEVNTPILRLLAEMGVVPKKRFGMWSWVQKS